MNLQKVKDISLYLTSRCNFNCTYCDRKFVIPSEITENDIEHIIRFIEYCFNNGCEPDIISFHGGEPLLKAQLLYEIVNLIENQLSKKYSHITNKLKYYIQTNGSLILKHKDKFSNINPQKIIYSISYDLIYQEKHRKKLEIDNVVSSLIQKGHTVKLQCVASPLELNNPLFHSILLQTCLNHKLHSFCILVLKHIRRSNYSEAVLCKEELPILLENLMKIVELSYIYDFKLLIDGNDSIVEKKYFDSYEQMILCGNGYLYPEYDFLDYDIKEARIGTWKNQIEFFDNIDDLNVSKFCKNCKLNYYCGLKYVYYFNNQQPNTEICINVYSIINHIHYYMKKLKEKSKLYKWVFDEK